MDLVHVSRGKGGLLRELRSTLTDMMVGSGRVQVRRGEKAVGYVRDPSDNSDNGDKEEEKEEVAPA